MTTTPRIHIETGQHPDGTWWAHAQRGQRPVNGEYRSVTVGNPYARTPANGYQTEQGAAVEVVRTWFATAERVGWL